MLLVSPLGWIYYYVLLIIPLVVAWNNAIIFRGFRLKATIIIAWLLCTIPYALLQGDKIRLIDIVLWSGLPFIGLLLFFIILVNLIMKTTKLNIVNARKEASVTNIQ